MYGLEGIRLKKRALLHQYLYFCTVKQENASVFVLLYFCTAMQGRVNRVHLVVDITGDLGADGVPEPRVSNQWNAVLARVIRLRTSAVGTPTSARVGIRRHTSV